METLSVYGNSGPAEASNFVKNLIIYSVGSAFAAICCSLRGLDLIW